MVQQARSNGDARIFPDWKEGFDKTFSYTSSKFFNRRGGFLERVKAKTEDNALYSLRHNFQDALAATGLTKREQDFVMGHADDSVYGSNETTDRVIAAVKSVKYDGLVLPPLGRFPEWTKPRE
jgi:hypothetical protein